MNDPLLSIIIPVYNSEEFLDNCINSVLKQSYSNFELILVDDESSDNSTNICKKYAHVDKRIHVIQKKNGGVSSARNVGLNYMHGEYVTFIDADDEISSDSYLKNIEYLINHRDIDMLQYPTYYNYGTDNQFLKNVPCQTFEGMETILENWWSGDILSGSIWNKIFKRDVFNQIRFLENHTGEDWYMLTDFLKVINKVHVSESGCYYYYYRQNSLSTNNLLNTQLDHFNAHFRNYKTLYTFDNLKKYRVSAFMRMYRRLLSAKKDYPEYDITRYMPEIKKYQPRWFDLFCSKIAFSEKIRFIKLRLLKQ